MSQVLMVLSSAMGCALLVCAGCASKPIGITEERSHEPSVTAEAGRAGDDGDGGDDEFVNEWCAVRDVLAAKCQRCHAEEPMNGAPFSLMTYADTQEQSRKGVPRFESMAKAIESDLMPPGFIELDPPVESLSDDERSLLLSWCERGAPGAEGGCDEP